MAVANRSTSRLAESIQDSGDRHFDIEFGMVTGTRVGRCFSEVLVEPVGAQSGRVEPEAPPSASCITRGEAVDELGTRPKFEGNRTAFLRGDCCPFGDPLAPPLVLTDPRATRGTSQVERKADRVVRETRMDPERSGDRIVDLCSVKIRDELRLIAPLVTVWRRPKALDTAVATGAFQTGEAAPGRWTVITPSELAAELFETASSAAE